MNIDPSKSAGNGNLASSSGSCSSKQYLANGAYPDRSYNCLSNDLTFPPGGIPSLRLPVVVVLYSDASCSLQYSSSQTNISLQDILGFLKLVISDFTDSYFMLNNSEFLFTCLECV